MIKFLKKILIFLLPIIFVFIGFEIFYRYIPNDYSYKFKTIPSKFDNTKILIFGNSHPFYGLNPIYFTKPTYNMSYVSQTLYFDKILFDKYIDKFKKIDCIILHIEYTTLSEVVDTDENKWRKYYYQYYMNLNISSIKPYDLKQYFLSSTRTFNGNIGLINNYLHHKTLINSNNNGFGTNYTKDKKQNFQKKDAVKRVKDVEDNLKDFTQNINRLQSIIEKCKSKNIKILLLRMPVSNYFAESVNQSKLKKIDEACEFIDKTNTNVIYLDLFNDKRFANDDFYDVDHLHNIGATKCSRIVDEFMMANK